MPNPTDPLLATKTLVAEVTTVLPKPLPDRRLATDIKAMHVSTLVANHFRRWRSGVATLLCLAPLVLIACGATTAKSTARVTSTRGLNYAAAHLHAPYGFSPARCPLPNPVAACYARSVSVVLTPATFARLVQTTGLALSKKAPNCLPQRPARLPHFRVQQCSVVGTTKSTQVEAHAMSLVLVSPESTRATTMALPSDSSPVYFELHAISTPQS